MRSSARRRSIKLNEKIEKALNGQFDEAQNKIDQARARWNLERTH